MIEKIKKYEKEISSFIPKSQKELEEFYLKFLGRKGLLNILFLELKKEPLSAKKKLGELINILKKKINKKNNFYQKKNSPIQNKEKFYDLTCPGFNKNIGSRHPISIVRNEIIAIFNKIGFEVTDGPEIENDWYNFTALNLPKYHPARDMQDTFFINKDISNPFNDKLLRTHTSSVQIRYMENNKPPIRILSCGRVFRNEVISSRSHCMFHQIEGLYVDKHVSFSDLKQTLNFFINKLFGTSKIRLRPSYFPFTEPSAEVDIYWELKNQVDYKITKGTSWFEIMGCGMVDPNVLENVGINSEEYSGYAFGMGIERIIMFLYQIGDIRLFFENDIRFLNQFKSE